MTYTSVYSDPRLEPKDNIPCTLTWTKLETDTSRGRTFKIFDISGHANPGEILAVMGESGSGKTTFLKALSGRIDLKRGEVNLNGEEIRRNHHRQTIGYVSQQDIFFDVLTLRQTLEYAAMLRLPENKLTHDEKMDKVKELIDVLKLESCADTLVGGLSGGEKKRCNIACELITNPQVLLIDEPTSGLDSYTAHLLITTLKDFATQQAKTVVITVHQPSSQMYQMFDSLLLICKGSPAYFGKTTEVISYFEKVGYPLSRNYNPAEFILEKLRSDKDVFLKEWKNFTETRRTSELSSSGRNNNNSPVSAIQPTATSQVANGKSIGEYIRIEGLDNKKEIIGNFGNDCSWPTSFCTQVKVLYLRNLRLAYPRIFSKVNVVQTIAFAFMAGLVWFNSPRVEKSLDDIEGYMFFSAHYWMLFVLFQALWAFPMEKPVIQKERQSGSYRISAYYISKMLAETPLELSLPCIYQAISYLMMGATVKSFFGILIFQIISSLASQSVGLLFGVSMEPSSATSIAAIFTVGAQLLGGYLTNNIPQGLKILSLVYNGLKNMQLIEYHMGRPIQCGTQSQFPSCSNDTGTGYIDPAELVNRDNADNTNFPYWSHTVFLILTIFVCRTLCYLVLRRSL